MKDQYVGDVSDYLKYSLLRAWSGRGLSTGLAWMRTEPDLRTDGGLTRYLRQSAQYRGLDPELFDGLKTLVATERRSVRALVDTGLVAHRYSYERLMLDGAHARDAWFADLAEISNAPRVLFLDPDNGLEVPSVPRGRVGSRRYVFAEELALLHGVEQAVCVYQHFPRVARRAYLDRQLDQLAQAWPGVIRFAVCSSRIALMVSAPDSLASELLLASHAMVRRDPGGVGAWVHVAGPADHDAR